MLGEINHKKCSTISKHFSDQSSSGVLKLTMCQAANGSFPPGSGIGSIMGLTSEKS
jgi:hypothetical protein